MKLFVQRRAIGLVFEPDDAMEVQRDSAKRYVLDALAVHLANQSENLVEIHCPQSLWKARWDCNSERPQATQADRQS